MQSTTRFCMTESVVVELIIRQLRKHPARGEGPWTYMNQPLSDNLLFENHIFQSILKELHIGTNKHSVQEHWLYLVLYLKGGKSSGREAGRRYRRCSQGRCDYGLRGLTVYFRQMCEHIPIPAAEISSMKFHTFQQCYEQQ